MTIAHNVYDTVTLLGVFRDLEPVNTYFLDTFFGDQITFTEEFIDFGKITDTRKLAPLVMPMAQGKPIFTEAAAAYRVKPGYIKPKDAVAPNRVIRRRPGELGTAAPLSPQARHDAIVADILNEHNRAINRRWEWMAASAILYGSVTLEDDGYPETFVDFQRAAGHSITLGVGARWGDAGVSIMNNIESWRGTMRAAPFGGPTNRITMGADAWDIVRKDDEIKAALDTNYRGNDANLRLGIRTMDEVEYVGDIAPGLPIYVYSGFYQDTSGTAVPLMNPKDVLLTGPNLRGTRAFGAILDVGAQFAALPIFPKMWNSQDPAVTYVMSQSAPLMVPVNPNASLRARVLA